MPRLFSCSMNASTWRIIPILSASRIALSTQYFALQLVSSFRVEGFGMKEFRVQGS